MDTYGIIGVVLMCLALLSFGVVFGVQLNLPEERQFGDAAALLVFCAYTLVFFLGVVVVEPRWITISHHVNSSFDCAVAGFALWLCGWILAIVLGYLIVHSVKVAASSIHHFFKS